MYLYINGFHSINEKNLPLKIIESCVSPMIFKSAKKEFWLSMIPSKLHEIDKKISTLIKT